MNFSKMLLAPVVMAAVAAYAAALPTVDGEVRKVDPARGVIVLKHGEIPNIGMPPMVMEYHADAKVLKDVKPGDKVKFQADMVQGQAKIVELRVVK